MKQHVGNGMLCHRRFTSVAFMFVCCFGGSAGQHSWGQGVTSTLAASKVAAPAGDLFSADLEKLSRRFGVAFVAEGEPIPVTKDVPVPSLSEKLSQEDAVQEVAAYFDYSAVRKGNVYLLTKQYTNPEDMPDVTPKECLAGLKRISNILEQFNPKIPPGTFSGEPMANIARLLNAKQMELLGTSGLPVSELTPSQHEEVWKLALKFYVQSQADDVDGNYTFLETRNPADPVFHWATIENIHAFGYDTRSFEMNKVLFIPVSNSNRIMVLPNGATGTFTRTSKHITVARDGTRKEETIPDTDPTDPSGVSEPTKQFLDDKGKSSHALSLANVLAAVNGHVTNPSVYKVEAMYAAKHVTLVGTDKLSQATLVRSVAGVYGLRVVQNEDGTFLLTHPVVVEANQLSDLGRALVSVIPAPIYRAIRTHALTAHAQASHKEINGLVYKRPEMPVALIEYQSQAAAIYRSAIQMFRYIAEPEVKSQPEQKLALSHLGERADKMFSIVSTVDAFAQACWLADRAVPPYIADFDHLTLTGGISHTAEGAERFSLHLSYTDPKTGTLYKGVGFSNAILP